MIVFCTPTEPERIDLTRQTVELLQQYNVADRYVILVNENEFEKLNEEDRQWFIERNCEVYTRMWNDDFPSMRNEYLTKCQHGDWILVLDSDERFSPSFCQDAREIIKECENRGYNIALINSHDIMVNENGEMTETTSDFFKNLIFKYEEGTYYTHVGERPVHETLVFPRDAVQVKLNRRYYYEHFKYYWQVWERATRNVFCTIPTAMIPTTKGVKQIRDITAGDVIMSISNLTRVEKTFTRDYEGIMYMIKAVGNLPLVLTPEHPLLVAEVEWDEKGKPTMTKKEWLESSRVKINQYLVIPKLGIEEYKLSDSDEKSINDSGNLPIMRTKSQKVAVQTQIGILLNGALGMVSYDKKRGEYLVYAKLWDKRKSKDILEGDDAYYVRIELVKTMNYKGKVYNLETSDETYLINSILVHNCGGGGNNVGSKNTEWIKLREICDELGITSWPQLRQYLKGGNIDPKLKDWIIKNRKAGFDYQNEMMEIFRYYFEYLHPEENVEGLKPITEVDEDSEAGIMRLVEQAYLKVLGRHADTAGKNHYTKLIMEGKIRKEELEELLKQSPEYHDNQGPTPNEGGNDVVEVVSTTIPARVSLPLTMDSLMALIKKTNTYAKFKEMIDFSQVWRAHLAINYKDETKGAGTDEMGDMNALRGYVDDITTWLPSSEYRTLLEIGAGAGDLGSVLVKEGYDYHGITLGRENIELARKKHGLNLLEMDMHFLNFPEGFFDAAVLIHTFEHAHAPLVVIGELYYVLRDGGRVYVAVPSPHDEDMHTIWHVNLMTKEQVIKAFEYWGFKLVSLISTASVNDVERRDGFKYVFEKLPKGAFKNWEYLQHVYKRRMLIR